MFNRFVKILPALAIFSGLTIIACFLILWKILSPLGVDNGRTIPLVKTTIAKLTDLHPASLDDPEFLKAMAQAEVHGRRPNPNIYLRSLVRRTKKLLHKASDGRNNNGNGTKREGISQESKK